MRAYSPGDVRDLIDLEGSFEIVSVHERRYDLDVCVDLDTLYGSAVLVLRRTRYATCTPYP